jgi:multiple sugar transport system substrate-binding protein
VLHPTEADIKSLIPAHYIEEALNAVYYGTKDPKEALDDAAAKSALILGW